MSLSLEEENQRLKAQLMEREEREAAVCPEDVGFEELVKSQAARITELEASQRLVPPLRAILDWWMCSDPWPGGDHDVIEEWLNGLCREHGYDSWVIAYHEVVEPSEEENDGT